MFCAVLEVFLGVSVGGASGFGVQDSTVTTFLYKGSKRYGLRL